MRSAATPARISSFGATATKLQPPVLTGAWNMTTSRPSTGSLASTQPSRPLVTSAGTPMSFAVFLPVQPFLAGKATSVPVGAATNA